MKGTSQTHQKPLGVLAGAVIWGYLGLALSAKWLRGLDLNQRPLGYESRYTAARRGPDLRNHCGCSLFHHAHLRHCHRSHGGSAIRKRPNRHFAAASKPFDLSSSISN